MREDERAAVDDGDADVERFALDQFRRCTLTHNEVVERVLADRTGHRDGVLVALDLLVVLARCQRRDETFEVEVKPLLDIVEVLDHMIPNGRPAINLPRAADLGADVEYDDEEDPDDVDKVPIHRRCRDRDVPLCGVLSSQCTHEDNTEEHGSK